jgi:oxygen-independent coproporphyrinogen-3 oxidase
LAREFGFDFVSFYSTELASLADLEADGIVQRDAEGLWVTEEGLPFVRVAAACFDAYLREGKGSHSRVV